MQKLPSSMPRYVKSASFLQFHVVLVCFWTIGPIWTICGICGFLRSFAAKSPKVQKLLNVGRSRLDMIQGRDLSRTLSCQVFFCLNVLRGWNVVPLASLGWGGGGFCRHILYPFVTSLCSELATHSCRDVQRWKVNTAKFKVSRWCRFIFGRNPLTIICPQIIPIYVFGS